MVGQSRFQTRKCETEDRLYETQAKKSTGEAGLLRTTHALCGRHFGLFRPVLSHFNSITGHQM